MATPAFTHVLYARGSGRRRIPLPLQLSDMVLCQTVTDRQVFTFEEPTKLFTRTSA
ncbi:MAG: hypothetical protein U0V56_07335 [Actinomycetota bacterium]